MLDFFYLTNTILETKKLKVKKRFFMNLVDLTVKNFVAESASDSPAPGGGSVAALAGSLGTALAQMVIRLTDEKKAFKALDESVQTKVKESLLFFEKRQAELLHLIDEDTKAFNSFMAALALPKSTDLEKENRAKAMTEAAILSMNIPLQTARTCFAVIENLKLIAMYGNKNAVSDIGVAMLMSDAALNAAILNVKINLQGLNDLDDKEKIEKECNDLITKSENVKKEVLKIVNEKIS